MPVIRVRKRTRANREDRVRRRALLGIAITVTLFALFHLPDAVAAFSDPPRNPVAFTPPDQSSNNPESHGRRGRDETKFMTNGSFGAGILDNIIAPEPGTLGLVGVGIVAFGIVARKRTPG